LKLKFTTFCGKSKPINYCRAVFWFDFFHRKIIIWAR